MNEPYYGVQDTRQQGPVRPQHNILQPQLIQPSRPVAPQERYRARRYDHPMYDAAENDDYGQDAQLDSFGGFSEVRVKCESS